jgi:hypothetical protein
MNLVDLSFGIFSENRKHILKPMTKLLLNLPTSLTLLKTVSKDHRFHIPTVDVPLQKFISGGFRFLLHKSLISLYLSLKEDFLIISWFCYQNRCTWILRIVALLINPTIMLVFELLTKLKGVILHQREILILDQITILHIAIFISIDQGVKALIVHEHRRWKIYLQFMLLERLLVGKSFIKINPRTDRFLLALLYFLLHSV